ncbi:MarR family winged helix-turn-helix transcriptional regulator [Modestobacter sp. Leaf380]|uniref:MarR family winged helix-turn-helix transcriptional regulator n=1 Tax=Modestobacter sp. Leaf380 TaxID=1736356 RepID=UPI00070143B2|nr:MarR family winged helix-turn-helix transcriptional regulator [Modestobacter sp. Leaf380]KQS73345.1 MarR family transcriptional regulator [Modestobacter sp. Leaf380]
MTWLDEEQQRLWRHWLLLSTRLPAALNRQLQADSDLSLADFEVLVQLSETPGGRVRTRDLGAALGWEKSRLSHHLTRMGTRGLVRRTGAADDARGSVVVLTDDGRSAIEAAAPGHVETVRELFFAGLGPDQVRVLTGLTDAVLARLPD